MNERYRSYKKLHRKVDWLISYLINERTLFMATWQDVKDAIAYGNEVDAQVWAKLTELKAKLDNLPMPEDFSDEFDAAVAEIRGHADETLALMADKPEVPEAPEAPAEEPVAEEPVAEEPTEVSEVPTDVAE